MSTLMDKVSAYNIKTADALSRAVRKGIVSIDDAANATMKLKLKPRKIKTIGQGKEGIVNLMTDPTYGKSAWKVYNPLGRLYSNELLGSKIRTYGGLKNNPGFAKYYGKVRNRPVTMHEYIKPRDAQSSGDFNSIGDFYKATMGRAGKPIDIVKNITIPSVLNGVKGNGRMSDILMNPGNIVVGDNGGKVIDFLTSKVMKTPAGAEASNFIKGMGANILKPKKLVKSFKDYGDSVVKDMFATPPNPRAVEAAAFNYDRGGRTFTPKYMKKMKSSFPDSNQLALDLFRR